MSVGRLRVLIAPDSFKGSLSSVDVSRSLAEGWARARPEDELILAPLADGGEGTLAAIAESGGWLWRECQAQDPLGRPLKARWLLSVDGARAAVELAEASGLSRLPRDEPRNPVAATTEGTGEILRAVLDAGVRHVMIGVGGSATTDGGAGLLRGLGARFGSGFETSRTAGAAAGAGELLLGSLNDVTHVDLSGLDPRLAQIELRVACDVTNPLLGRQGAAAVYGPQKGAWPEDVAALEAWLSRYADLLETASGVRARDRAGAGAAGAKAAPAHAENSGLVSVVIPPAYADRTTAFLSELENLTVEADRPARVIINERTGTIVFGKDVHIAPVAILHGNLNVEIQTTFTVSQPAPLSNGTTEVVPQTSVGAKEEKARNVLLKQGATVEDLVRALAAIGSTPRDVIDVLQSLRAAGALEAEVDVM